MGLNACVLCLVHEGLLVYYSFFSSCPLVGAFVFSLLGGFVVIGGFVPHGLAVWLVALCVGFDGCCCLGIVVLDVCGCLVLVGCCGLYGGWMVGFGWCGGGCLFYFGLWFLG